MMDFKERGKSIILVSHTPSDIEQLCDRAMFLKNGHIDAIGKPTEVLDAYRNYMDSLQK